MHKLQKDEKGRRYYQLDEQFKQMVMSYPPGPIWCTVVASIDMTDADLFRNNLRRDKGVHISITSLIIKASANALKDFPILCGIWRSMDSIWCPNSEEINIVCPVQVGDLIGFCFIDKASQKTLLEISKELETQVNEIRSTKKVGWPEERQPKSFFNIVNVGTIGPVDSGVAPFGLWLVSGLGIGAIQVKPIVRDRQIQVRKMMNASLNFDHRAMMANMPIEFLTQLKRNLEEPNIYLV
jgi:pyruvate dehydrogenase E2 component (dihydrolipoamide acetyltransferase)